MASPLTESETRTILSSSASIDQMSWLAATKLWMKKDMDWFGQGMHRSGSVAGRSGKIERLFFCIGLRVREKELLAVQLVAGNEILTLVGNEPLGHFFGKRYFGLGMPGRVHRDETIGIGK